MTQAATDSGAQKPGGCNVSTAAAHIAINLRVIPTLKNSQNESAST
jgi:hypothetical protein